MHLGQFSIAKNPETEPLGSGASQVCDLGHAIETLWASDPIPVTSVHVPHWKGTCTEDLVWEGAYKLQDDINILPTAALSVCDSGQGY